MLSALKLELERLVAAGNAPETYISKARHNGFIEIGERRLLDFTNWDVLAVAEQPRVKLDAQEEIEAAGGGVASSRGADGYSTSLAVAEERLSKFLFQDASLFCSSQNQALLTLTTSLFTGRDCLFVEETCQALVQDAARLIDAEVVVYRHGELPLLAQEPERKNS